MKKIIILISLQFYLLNVFPQSTFEKTYGTIDDDAGYSVDICPDGSYLVCGYTTEFFYGYEDIFILKLDQDGEIIWTKVIGSESGFERAYSIKCTNDGGFVICGYNPNPCLLKFDANGQEEWTKEYSNIIPDGTAFDVIQISDSSYAVCGNSVYSDSGSDLWGSKIFLLKTDQQGEHEWLKLYGGSGVHYPGKLTQNELGGYTICGKNDTPGEYDAAWVIKTLPNGTKIDEFMSGGEQSIESAWDLKRTSDDGYILVGTKFNGIITMNGDIQFQKVDVNLNEVWTKQFSSGPDNRGNAVDILDNDEYILCGTIEGTTSSYDDIWLIRTDANGDTLWTQTYGGYYIERGYSLKCTPDGGFIICGSTMSIGNGMDDVYLIKTNPQGTLVWSQEYSVPRNQINIFPNPGNGIFHIQSNISIDRVELLNANQQVLKQFDQNKPEKTSMDFNITDFPSGIYFLRLYSEQKTSIRKIIKH